MPKHLKTVRLNCNLIFYFRDCRIDFRAHALIAAKMDGVPSVKILVFPFSIYQTRDKTRAETVVNIYNRDV